MGDALHNIKALFQKLVVGHYLVDQANTQGLLGIDMVTSERVTQSVLEAR